MKIFHHTDNDGRLSAAIVKRKYPDGICVPYDYSGQFPWHMIKKDEEIIIVDLSFKNQSQFNDVLKRTKNLTWIDHHYTSKQIDSHKIKGIRVESKPSACVLCWQYFFPDELIPEEIKLVNDYDTWTHEFGEKTRFFNVAMTVYDSPESWLKIINSSKSFIEQKIEEGEIIERYLNSYYKRMAQEVIFNTTFHKYKAAVCNVYKFGADVFKYWEDKELKITFYFDGLFYHVSMYSNSVEVNCAAIAEKYGGGGHRMAAGFKIMEFPFDQINMMGVYKIEFIPDGKIYIGSTVDGFKRRFQRHIRLLNNNMHENQYLQNYWNKYGKDSFKFDIIEICNKKEEIWEREKFWIDIYFNKGKNFCFNLSDHVCGGNTLKTEEIKRKHHEGLIKSYTPELRRKRSNFAKLRANDTRVILKETMKTDMWKENHLKGVRELVKRESWKKSMINANRHKMKKVKTDRGKYLSQ